MTESVETVPYEDTPEDAASRERFREKMRYDTDLRLDLHLDLIFGPEDENEEGSAGITLVTPGGIIEGTVVHFNKYVDSQIQEVATSSEEMARYLLKQHAIFKQAREELPQNVKDEHKEGRRKYVHFLEATVTTGTNHLLLKNLRVDLTDVIAWAYGHRTYGN